MIQIPVRVAGDEWFNQDEVWEKLTQAPRQLIELDLHAEGPSLHSLGVVDTVLKSGVDPNLVTIINWHNSVENVPFERQIWHRASHFFWQHQLHTTSGDYNNQTDKIFGLFIGRRTISRCKIFYDVWHSFAAKSCLSLMNCHTPLPWQRTPGINLEKLNDWVSESSKDNFLKWWQHPPAGSIDGASIRDQYNPDQNTNFSLLNFYNQFDIEIACETYCYGNAFFPTEKTVRPIAAGKPFVLFGPVDFLQRLQQMGFRTYSEFWDESYDKLEGHQRWISIQRVLDYIQQQHSANWIKSVNTVAEHNRQHLKEIVKKYQPL